MAFEAIISDTTRPTPQPLTRRRNGMSVTPDIGARITGLSRLTVPIMGDMGLRLCLVAYLIGNSTANTMFYVGNLLKSPASGLYFPLAGPRQAYASAL